MEAPGAELRHKTDAVRERLAEAHHRYGRLTYANSLGAEAIVLTDIITSHIPQIDIFTIDTGRLHEETRQLLEKLQRRYQGRIRVVYPDAAQLERLVRQQGINGFYQSVEARMACCRVRKLKPFQRAISGFPAWITGLRRQQSAERASTQPVEWDSHHGLYKISPLLDWTDSDVWAYIRAHELPYNLLHDRGYPSIGCAPCTRAIRPGEPSRAGRWWWEQAESGRECGLHPRKPRPVIPIVAVPT